MMNRKVSRIAVAVLVFCTALVASNTANGQQHMNSVIDTFIASDFNSGYAQGSGNGRNAVATQITSNANYYYDEYANRFHVSAGIIVSGIWGDPTAMNPYYTMMENGGIHTNCGVSLQQATWNGQYYEFDELVWLHAQGNAQIYHFINHDGLPLMNGSMNAYIQGGGAIPINSMSFITLYDHVGGTGDRNPDWQVTFYTDFLVTSSFHQLPTPGSATLIGLGGLVGLRRRRR